MPIGVKITGANLTYLILKDNNLSELNTNAERFEKLTELGFLWYIP